ncbi:MAG: hypothetical protein NTV21_07540 [Planctomycetota bacterium]|nr:hypothetical protein [Planctomycetota bacterium]
MHKFSFQLAVVGLLASSGFAQDNWPFNPIRYFESGTGVTSANIPDTGGVWPGTMPTTYLSQTFQVPFDVELIYGIELTGLSHTYIGDLQIVLIAPSGAGYNILHRPGFTGTGFGSAASFSGTYAFMDQGVPFPTLSSGVVPTSISVGQAYSFSFGNWPDGQHGFANASSISAESGTWQLRVYDWATQDTGSVTTPKLEGQLYAHYKVDYGNAGQVPSPNFAPAGGYPGHWNAMDNSTGPLTLPTSAVAPANCTIFGASATYTRSGTAFPTFTFDNPNTTGDNQLLLDDALDLGGVGNQSTVTISGLPIGNYYVWVYAWAPDDPIGSRTWVVVNGGLAETKLVGGADWPGVYNGITTHFDTVAVTNGSLTFGAITASGFGSINGFEIAQAIGGTSGAAVTNCPSGGSLNGCFPNLTYAGNTSFAANDGYLFCVVDGNRSGGFFYGLRPADGMPFGTGTAKFCVAPPRVRLGGILNSGGTTGICNGVFQFDMDQWWNSGPTGLGLPPTVGQSLYFQAWLRDAGNGSSNIATSNGLRLTFQP